MSLEIAKFTLQGSFAARALRLLALAGFAIGQPLLDLLARHGELFVVRRFDRQDIALLVLALLVLPALPAIFTEALATVAPRRFQRSLHQAWVGLFAGLAVLLFLAPFEASAGRWLPLAALLAGVTITALYARRPAVRHLVSLLAIGLALYPLAFFAQPKIARLMRTRNATERELPAVGSQAPIVFLVFDELSLSALLDEEGHIDRRRFPHFAAFAEISTWHRNTYAVAETTADAVPPILTGNFPKGGALPTLEEHPHNIFTLFGGDYDLWAREPITRLSPPELNRASDGRIEGANTRGLATDLAVLYLHRLLPPPYARGLPTLDEGWTGFGAKEVGPPGSETEDLFARATEEMTRDRRLDLEDLRRSLRRSREPTLYFLHALLPHRPWRLLPDGRRYPLSSRNVPGLDRDRWNHDPYFAEQGYGRYLWQLGYIDTALGQLFARLRELDLFERSLIVIVADHGMSFEPGEPVREITATNAHELLPVPWFLKAPGQTQGRIVDHPARTVDVLPTLLAALDVESPWPMDGKAISGDSPPDESTRLPVLTVRRGTLEIEITSLAEGVRRRARFKAERFAPPEEPWIGRSVEDLPPGPPAPKRWGVAIDGFEHFANVDPRGDSVPAFLRGHVIGPPPSRYCCELAIALDGKIVATARTHLTQGRRRRTFTALLPFEAFHEGDHQLEIFLVDARAEGPLLRRFERVRG